jgi:hypothetical protein
MLQKSQVLSRRLYVSCAAVLPFKDSEGGTWPLQLSDFKRTYICRHAPVKKSIGSMQIVAWDLPLNNNSVPPLARPLNPAALRPVESSRRIPLAGLRRGLARLWLNQSALREASHELGGAKMPGLTLVGVPHTISERAEFV